MRWTGWAALLTAGVTLGGCVYGYAPLVQARYSRSSRPHPSYYCYDCHGYRYFDPYYDYCVGRGFLYRWSDHPRVIDLYRQRYPRIRENHPEYGRFRYAPDYRSSTRYREERRFEGRHDEDDDRDGDSREGPRFKDRDKDGSREKSPGKPGRKHDDSREKKRTRGQAWRPSELAGRRS